MAVPDRLERVGPGVGDQPVSALGDSFNAGHLDGESEQVGDIDVARSRNLGDVWFAMGDKISRSSKSEFKAVGTPQPGPTAMFGNLFVMYGDQHRRPQPDPIRLWHAIYFASSRSACRRRFMTFRAACICSSKAGS